MRASPVLRSDELLRGEELGQLGAAVALVGDDLRRRLRGGRAGEATRPRSSAAPSPTCAGVDAEVGQRPASRTGFFFAAMIPLNDG